MDTEYREYEPNLQFVDAYLSKDNRKYLRPQIEHPSIQSLRNKIEMRVGRISQSKYREADLLQAIGRKPLLEEKLPESLHVIWNFSLEIQ